MATARTNTKSTAPAPARRATGALTEQQLLAMPESDYMNAAQVEFFRQRLIQQRAEVLARLQEYRSELGTSEVFADPADRASADEARAITERLRQREVLHMRKIDEALESIRSGDYGYCVKTGNAIGLPRMLARPTATLCVHVKGIDEMQEQHFRQR